MKNRNPLIILPLLFAPAMAMAHPWFIRDQREGDQDLRQRPLASNCS